MVIVPGVGMVVRRWMGSLGVDRGVPFFGLFGWFISMGFFVYMVWRM